MIQHMILLTILCAATVSCRAGGPSREGYVAGHGGIRIFYKVVGTGPDTVVAIHGGPGGDMNNIAPDLEPLSSQHTVIYYDQRGGGRSDLPADTSLLHARYFVEDLEALRRHFGLERMNLLAHSFGPVLTARYAQTYPERVARMMFVGAIGPRKADAQAYGRTMYSRMDAATRESTIALVRGLIEGTSDAVAACRAYQQLGRDWERRQGDSISPKSSLCSASPASIRYSHMYTSQVTLASLGEWDYTATLREVAAPLLIFYGERDPSPISSARAWAAAVPNGRILVVPGARKGVHIDRPELFFAAVDTFLAGRWPGAAVRAAVN